MIRGNLHVIPVGNSILYVSPLYLRAATGQVPELKRVIAAYGKEVVMEETPAQARAALFTKLDPASQQPGVALQGLAAASTAAHVQQALSHYHQAMERLKAGDWQDFGAELDKLRLVLEQSGHTLDGR